jgi:hypothetical protein
MSNRPLTKTQLRAMGVFYRRRRYPKRQRRKAIAEVSLHQAGIKTSTLDSLVRHKYLKKTSTSHGSQRAVKAYALTEVGKILLFG